MSIVKKNKVFTLFIVLILIATGYSNKLFAQKRIFKFNHYTVSDGLSHGAVFSILQDSKGFMWFGTRAGGLNKFDAYSFTTYQHNDSDCLSISGNEIISLFEDSYGIIWAGTRNDGLSRFDYEADCFHQYRRNPSDTTSLVNNTINCIYEFTGGDVWFGTNNGLCKYDRKNDAFISYTQNKGLAPYNIKTLVSAGDGLLWIGAKKGLVLYDVKNFKVLKHFKHDKEDNSSMSDSYVTSLIVDKDERLWIGTQKGGLNRLENIEKGEFKRYMHSPERLNSISSNVIRTLHQDKNGIIWIGTKVALETLMPDQQEVADPIFIHHVKDHDDNRSLSQNSIFSFYEDKYGDFWVGTWSGGINYLHTGALKFDYYRNRYHDPESLSENVVRAIVADEDYVWVGTETKGLNRLNRKTDKFTHFTSDKRISKSLANNGVKSLLIDNSKDLWVGTHTGIDLYNKSDGSFTHFLSGHNVYTIEEDGNTIWVGTTNNLFRINKFSKRIEEFAPIVGDSSAISYQSINKIFLDSKGQVWVGTKLGLNLYNRERNNFTQFYHTIGDSSSLSHSHITTITEDSIGRLWIGTIDGLNLYNSADSTFITYRKEKGVNYTVINNLQVDNSNRLWFTTSRNLVCFDPNEKMIKKAIRSYDVADGLQSNEFIRNASFKDKAGCMYYGGNNGFNVFHPDSLHNNENVPQIVITSFKLFNREVPIGDKGSLLTKHISRTSTIKLKYKQSVISLGYVALNYASPQKNKYAYKMEGFEKDWNFVGNKREATYTSLPSGEYVFKVIGSNNDEVWNYEGASINIIVLPPWWETWWFRGLVLLFLLWISRLYYLHRISNMKERQLILEHKVNERTFKLQKASSELKLKQDEIQSQNVELNEQKEELEITIERLKETQSQLVHSEKMASIGVLTAGIAHEINNPLNFIQGGKTILEEYVNDNLKKHIKEVTPSLVMIQNGINRASAIVKSLNHFNHTSVNYSELCDIHLIIENCLSIMHNQLKQKAEVETKFTDSEFVLKGNTGELHQLIINILINAEQSIASKGIITIETKLIGENLSVIISDTGCGIPQENIKKVTEPFFTTKEPGQGTGLGMSIAYSIINRHKGSIELKSKVGKGTSLYLRLPVVVN